MSATGSSTFTILFNGELRAGATRDSSLEQLSILTNIDRAELFDALFSVKPVIVNQVENEALAETYRAALEESGLQVWIEPLDEAHDEIINVELEFGHYAPIERAESAPNYVIDTDELDDSPIPEDDTLSPAAPSSAGENPCAVIFYGEFEPGIVKAEAIDNIRHLTKASTERIVEELFSVVPVIVKRTANKALAGEYLTAFSRAGLKLELHTDPVELDISESSLTFRYDAPPPLPIRHTRRFTYYLLGIAGLAVIAWGAIFISMDGFFRQPLELTLEIELQAAQPVAVIDAQPAALIEAQPVAAIEAQPESVPVKPDVPAPAPQPKPKGSTASKPEAKAKQPRIKSSAQLTATEQSYYMTLLSWFAHPKHQQYDSETRQLNLEGEIELQITIKRDGTLKNVTVARSSSEELTEVTTATARRASPYPAIPDAISGAEYSFTLPLKYTLEDSL